HYCIDRPADARALPSFPTRRSSDLSRTAGETVTGGPYTISATLSPTAVLSNYAITYNTGSFTINKAHLTVSADAKQRLYGSANRSEEHTSELQSRGHLVCRLLLEKK